MRALFAFYFCILVAAAWWPFDFMLPVRPKPYFESFDPSLMRYRNRFEKDTLKVAMFIPIGIFLLLTSGRLKGIARPLARAALGGLLLSILIQAGRYFLPIKIPEVTDVILNTFGASLGGAVICFRFLSRRALGWLTVICVACFVIAATWPFHFAWYAASPRALAMRFEWSPYHADFSFDALRERALNGLMMMPLGLLATAFALRRLDVKQALRYTTQLGFASSISVELLQCFLPTRTPSLSDLMLNTLGTLAGGLVAVYLDRHGVIRESSMQEKDEAVPRDLQLRRPFRP